MRIIQDKITTMKITSNSLQNIYSNKSRQQNKRCFEKSGITSYSSQPAFKGRLDIFKSIVNKLLSRLKKNEIPESKTIKLNETQTNPNTQLKAKTFESRIFPFDAEKRLSNMGITKENAKKILKTAAGNKEHLLKLTRMYKAGIEQEYIPEIFQSCKKFGGKLNVPLHNSIFILKDKAHSKYIAAIINNFKDKTKFDYAAFDEFLNLKSFAYKSKVSDNGAFKKMSPDEIDDFFFSNIGNIKTTASLLGLNNFSRLYKYDIKYLQEITNKTPSLLESFSTNPILEKLLKTKMNPARINTETNAGLFEKTDYSPQAEVEFQDRISTLMKLFEYPDIKARNKNFKDSYEMTSLLKKLPS